MLSAISLCTAAFPQLLTIRHIFTFKAMDLAEGTVRESGVVFHPIGIADEDNDRGFKGWKMRTLSK